MNMTHFEKNAVRCKNDESEEKALGVKRNRRVGFYLFLEEYFGHFLVNLANSG